MLYIFEMANNHMGSVAHAKKIVDQFAELAIRYKLTAGIKLQFRNLDTFIHPEFQNRTDLKYVKRFNETRLTEEQFSEIVKYIKSKNMLAITTPFDQESIPMTDRLNIDVIKVASCSVDDWPLLEEVSKINKKIIISTAGAELNTLRKVYSMFKRRGRDFAFMHCVGEYPTPIEYTNLDRIEILKREFPDIEIGFSTHESPLQKSMTPYAVAKGCTIVEKHIGTETDEYKLNAYSLNVMQMEDLVRELQEYETANNGISDQQVTTLKSLKRGVYVKADLSKGHILTEEDIFYAMPAQPNMLDASNYFDIIGAELLENKSANDKLCMSDIVDTRREKIISDIKRDVFEFLEKANVTVTDKDDIELSCHHGVENFYETGCAIISKINRAYCKKILVMLPNQCHPTHHHMIKEESFELLYGDCELVLNDRKIVLRKGDPKLINTGVAHSFSSKKGCVIEEVSTTHIPGDSVYRDAKINKLSLADRKVKVAL